MIKVRIEFLASQRPSEIVVIAGLPNEGSLLASGEEIWTVKHLYICVNPKRGEPDAIVRVREE